MRQSLDPPNAGTWATPERRAALGVLLWLILLAVVSLAVSTPFRLVGAGGAPSDAHAIYLNGLVVSTAAFAALLASDAFELRGSRARLASVVLWGAAGGSALGGVGGILDVVFGGTSLIALALIGLLALGVALVALATGLLGRAASTRRTRDWAAAMAAVASVGAVLMAYVAAWMLTFGSWPRTLVHGYPLLVGMASSSVWRTQLATSYAHLMPAAIVALAASTAAAALPAETEGGLFTRVGLLWLTGAVVLCTLVYMVSGFSVAQPPILFQSGPADLNGLWAGNLEVAVGVVLGALATLVGLTRERLPAATQRRAAALVAALLLVVLLGLGSYVELHESLFGLGALTAPRAAANAAFTWFVQDVGWLLLPGLLALLAALDRLVATARTVRAASLLVAAGGVVAVAGGLASVLAAPAPLGAGFVITGVGLLAALAGVAAAAGGAVRASRAAAASTSVQPEYT